MFCRNCGKQLTEAAETCLSCGAKRMSGTSFCPGCGARTAPLTEVCTNCGTQLAKAVKGKTWKTTAAGILAIVTGALSLAVWVAIAVLNIRYYGWLPIGGDAIGIVATVVVAIEMAIGIVAIVGGAFALKRKMWRLALAGSICAVFSIIWIPILLNVPLAIAAIVLVVLGKGEFEQSPTLCKSSESELKEV